MTFQEYINQTDPVKASGVIVTKEDCYQTYSDKPHGIIIVLEMFGTFFKYLLTEDNNHLYTIDSDGNKDKLSCFVWEG